jgi:Fis family transcriptional regulator
MATSSGAKSGRTNGNGSSVHINGLKGVNGSSHGNAKSGAGARGSAPIRLISSTARTREIPLRGHTERALQEYFASLNGHRPARLYDMVMHEVEEPLFRAVLDYAAGNQSRAAGILGINRGTLRKKLRALGLAE